MRLAAHKYQSATGQGIFDIELHLVQNGQIDQWSQKFFPSGWFRFTTSIAFSKYSVSSIHTLPIGEPGVTGFFYSLFIECKNFASIDILFELRGADNNLFKIVPDPISTNL